MIPRYSLPVMAALWSEERKLAAWQKVEVLTLEAWAELGVVPRGAARAAREAGPVDPTAVREREAVTRHDVAAFVDVLAGLVGDGGEWVHYGLTSSDVVDTAQAVLLREAAGLLVDRTADLFETLRRRALEHRDTIMVGRTHGVWAEPTTFGLKLAVWAFETARAHDRLVRARDLVSVGKISGAVGTYAHVPPEVEAFVCERLGLEVEPASTQITHRDRHAELLTALALTGASLERFATEIRLLSRSEVAEVAEPFREGQKGSSAMPHKRNPVRSERICGLARLLRAYAQAGIESISLWHERDISHSSVERVTLPDACLVLDFLLAEMQDLAEGLVVDAARMAANLDAARGLVFSQSILLALIREGLGRDEAYRIVQEASSRVGEGAPDLHAALADLPDLPLDAGTLEACFDPAAVLSRTGVVFERLEGVRLSGS